MSRCGSCHRRIAWCRTEAGKKMPVDVAEDPAGNVELTGRLADDGLPVVRVLAHTRPSADLAVLHRSHFATCPQSGSWRR